MERVAYRFGVAAAVALTAGGLIAAPAMMPALPDVQVRDFDLAAALLADLDSQIETVENHIQQALSGGGDLDQPGLGDLLLDRPDGALNDITGPTAGVGDLQLDQSLLNGLLGPGLDLGPLSVDPGAAGGSDFDGGSPGGVFGGSEQDSNGAATAAAAASALPAVSAGFIAGIVSAESQLNSELVADQAAALQQLPGTDTGAEDLANWMFNVYNTALAHGEQALNSLLGVTNFDPSDVLIAGDPDLSIQALWSALMGLDPADFGAVLHAGATDNLVVLLGALDWSTLFPGLS